MKLMFLILCLSFPLWAFDQLEFKKIYFAKNKMEMSGITYKNNSLYLVADKISDHFIYKVELKSPYIHFRPEINLRKLNGFTKYLLKTTFSVQGGHIAKSPLDLEGIAYCGDDWFLANEQARQILQVNHNSISSLEIDFQEAFNKNKTPLSSINFNAGFEGVAIDCKREIIYVAQEREPKAIISINKKNLKVIDFYDIESTNLNTKLSLDFSDLYFENDFLYILERNLRVITKFNPQTKKVISRFKYDDLNGFSINDLYKRKKNYGLAEGLTMNKNTIYIALDNNKYDLTKKAKKHFNIKNVSGTILEFKRPENF